MDILELDRTAVLETVRLLEHATPEDWERPTPCAGWDLRRLVAHMAGQHHGFAAAAAGGGSDLAAWQDRPLGDHGLATYRASTEIVLGTFAEQGVLTREFSLPEISTELRFPATVAIGFHFLDYVVHGWDVAQALGVELNLSEKTAEAALLFALRVPDDERRLGPEAQFAPSLPAGAGKGSLDLILAALGRSTDWHATGAVPPPRTLQEHHRDR
ncbi:TIGR03086 family metal-binding protein [Streptomyces sp. NBC_00094]|uniref:TIGR03086 family metal-binding protein n=1 Tax=Streptomyces sp. NBC_00094 TaxID=2903620 RepID=UPI002254586B|nr:TIGR03086 family metal-binding protein [Streptomyces sp. NBC_00094]MCX5394417.1 TIGR03086 family metal-binding protein [Streptomyces sp. NBC_00094]